MIEIIDNKGLVFSNLSDDEIDDFLERSKKKIVKIIISFYAFI